MRSIILGLCFFMTASSTALAASESGSPPFAASTPEESRLDAAVFERLSQNISENFADVQSVSIILQGRKVFEFYRDGQPNLLRPVHSVAKSALAVLVGTALEKGQLKSIDEPVVHLMPEWRALNPSPRAQTITLKHLLSMTPGFDVNDPTGTAQPMAAAQAWARTIGANPGTRFAYDNSVPNLVAQVLERATGQPIAELAQTQLMTPLGMQAPSLIRGKLSMRTEDMAKLGQLMLQKGQWADHTLLSADFVQQIVEPLSSGGAPTRLPYGLMWWVPSSKTYLASGYGGQLIWVHIPLGLVVAITTAVSPQGVQRGQALKLVRGPIFQLAQKRLAVKSGG